MKKKTTVTKLELKKPAVKTPPKKEDFYAELDRDRPPASSGIIKSAVELPEEDGRDHYNQNHNCLIVAAYFIFVYVVFVLGLLMLANTTHQTDRRLSGLLAAQNAVEIRDQLQSEFGSITITWPWHWSNPFSGLGQKATDTVTNQANNLLNQAEQDATKKAGDQARTTVNQALPK